VRDRLPSLGKHFRQRLVTQKVMSWLRSGNLPAILARMAAKLSCPAAHDLGMRSVSHDSIAVSAAIITGSTAHNVSSKSKLKTPAVHSL